MSSKNHVAKVGFWMSIFKMLAITIILWGIVFFITLGYIGMADTAGVGWDHYQTRDHWYKMTVPALWWWMGLLFANAKWQHKNRVFVLTLLALIVLGVFMFFWAFQEIPLDDGGIFWYREMPADLFGRPGLRLMMTLFPDVHVPPPPP